MTKLLSKTLFISLLLSAVITSRVQAAEGITGFVDAVSVAFAKFICNNPEAILAGLSGSGVAALEEVGGEGVVATGVGIGVLTKIGVQIGGWIGGSSIGVLCEIKFLSDVMKPIIEDKNVGKMIGAGVASVVGGVVAKKVVREKLLPPLEKNFKSLKSWYRTKTNCSVFDKNKLSKLHINI